MEEDLHALKFTKKEEPKQLALRIAKISMRYKKPLTEQKKAVHIMRLGKAHYADVLCAEERACQRQRSRSCTSKEILECMTSVSGKGKEESLTRTVIASQQMSWHLRTFRKREDSKVTVINVVSQVIKQLNVRSRTPRGPRPTITARNQSVLSVDKKVILRPSAFISLGILDMRSSLPGIRSPRQETKKQATRRYFLPALMICYRGSS